MSIAFGTVRQCGVIDGCIPEIGLVLRMLWGKAAFLCVHIQDDSALHSSGFSCLCLFGSLVVILTETKHQTLNTKSLSSPVSFLLCHQGARVLTSLLVVQNAF